jgi:hypothetical protein
MLWILYYVFLFTPLTQFAELMHMVPSSQQIARFWESLTPATCMPDHCFCEPVQSAIIRQPINTITNLAFILAGVLVIGIALYDWLLKPKERKTNLMRSHWIYSIIYGTAAILVGIGSMIYHSTMSFFGQNLDIMGMYLVAIFMALYNFSRVQKLSTKKFLFWYLLTNLLCFTVATIEPELRRPLFIGMLAAILTSDALVRFRNLPRANTKYYLASILSLAIGCTTWILDIQNIGCNPTGIIQLHSVWHIGMGSAIFFLYLYYRSETILHSSTSKIISKEEYACYSQ